MIPKRTSNNLAVIKGVGDTEDIVDRVVDYWQTLFKSQVSNYNSLRAVIPNYRRTDFETEE
jgi:hypothetical protein